jgi:hypothetical protein
LALFTSKTALPAAVTFNPPSRCSSEPILTSDGNSSGSANSHRQAGVAQAGNVRSCYSVSLNSRPFSPRAAAARRRAKSALAARSRCASFFGSLPLTHSPHLLRRAGSRKGFLGLFG